MTKVAQIFTKFLNLYIFMRKKLRGKKINVETNYLKNESDKLFLRMHL